MAYSGGTCRETFPSQSCLPVYLYQSCFPWWLYQFVPCLVKHFSCACPCSCRRRAFRTLIPVVPPTTVVQEVPSSTTVFDRTCLIRAFRTYRERHLPVVASFVTCTGRACFKKIRTPPTIHLRSHLPPSTGRSHPPLTPWITRAFH